MLPQGNSDLQTFHNMCKHKKQQWWIIEKCKNYSLHWKKCITYITTQMTLNFCTPTLVRLLRGLLFHPVCLFMIGLSAGLHKKTAKRISRKLRWNMDLSPEWTPLTLGADPGIYSQFSLTMQDFFFFFVTLSFISQGTMHGPWWQNISCVYLSEYNCDALAEVCALLRDLLASHVML